MLKLKIATTLLIVLQQIPAKNKIVEPGYSYYIEYNLNNEKYHKTKLLLDQRFGEPKKIKGSLYYHLSEICGTKPVKLQLSTHKVVIEYNYDKDDICLVKLKELNIQLKRIK